MTESEYKDFVLKALEARIGIDITTLTMAVMNRTGPTLFDEILLRKTIQSLEQEGSIVTLKVSRSRVNGSFLFLTETKFTLRGMEIAT